MFPHIYHGYIPTNQQQIIKAKIDHYTYEKDDGYFNKPLNSSSLSQSTKRGDSLNSTNNQSAYFVKSFDPKQNTTNTTITMSHATQKTHSNRVDQLMNSVEKVALSTTRSIKSEQLSIRPNSNQFINKKLTETTSGDYRTYSSTDFPKRVTAQQVEFRKGPQNIEKHEYEHLSTSISQRNKDELSRIPASSYNPKNHLVKTDISEDFKPSTITKCPPGKLALTQPDIKTYPKPECGLDGQPSGYSTDFSIKNDFLSSTADIEGVHPYSKFYRSMGYSGYVPDENHTSMYGKTLSNSNGNNNTMSKSFGSSLEKNTVAFSSTNGMNANQSLYRNNGSLRQPRCITFQSSNHGSNHLPGYGGFISPSISRDSKPQPPSNTSDYHLVNTMKKAASIENPNVTREDYMKGWKNDSQLKTIFGDNKDKSYFRNNAMLREFYTYNY